jgi:threonine dehydratase
VVAEAAGVAILAALLSGRYRPHSDEHVGVLLSGGNTIAMNFNQ